MPIQSAHTERLRRILKPLAEELNADGRAAVLVDKFGYVSFAAIDALATGLAEALGPELYIVDELIHRIDPAMSTEPTYTGICSICGAEVDDTYGLRETHTDDCALAAAIVTRGEEEHPSGQ